jgi:hypothetical protein
MALRRALSLERIFSETYLSLHDLSYELLGLLTSLFMLLGIHLMRDVFDEFRLARERAETEACAKEAVADELRQAMARIKFLSGYLPICAHCKAIRDDTGQWQRLEDYVTSHTDAEFTHGMCPDCAAEFYPELMGKSSKV